MVVIVIVGVLSAAAIPQFLGLKDRAEAGSMIGSMSGFAKECATGQITSTAAIIDSTKLENAGITSNLAPASDDGQTQTAAIACDGEQPITFSNTEGFEASKIGGMVCAKSSDTGEDQEADGLVGTCTITVAADGQISGQWST